MIAEFEIAQVIKVLQYQLTFKRRIDIWRYRTASEHQRFITSDFTMAFGANTSDSGSARTTDHFRTETKLIYSYDLLLALTVEFISSDWYFSTNYWVLSLAIDIFGTNGSSYWILFNDGYLIRLNIYTPEASFEYPISWSLRTEIHNHLLIRQMKSNS